MVKLLAFLPLVAPPLAAQDLFGPAGGPPSLEAGFYTASAGGSPSREARAAASSPLGSAGPWKLRLSVSAAHLRSEDDGYFPGEIWKTGAALSARNGRFSWAAGARSNSDRPFADADTADFTGDFSYAVTTGTHRLSAGLNFSSNRSFWRGLPFPYLLYSYMSESTQFSLPFFLRTRAADGLWLTFSYIPVSNWRASARLETGESAYWELETYSKLEQYLPYGRPDPDLRLYRQTAAALLKRGLALGGGLSAEVSAGYAFSNSYFTGESYDDVNDKVRLGGGLMAGLSLRLVPGGGGRAGR